jgi:hypothetical protein
MQPGTPRFLLALSTRAQTVIFGSKEVRWGPPRLAGFHASGLTIERNNNPGAIRVPGSMQFQRFSSPDQGIQAQHALLGRYMQHGLNNVSSIIERYAPRASRGGDNTDAQVNNYIAYVAKRAGVNPADTLSPVMVPRVAKAMREFETGKRGF